MLSASATLLQNSVHSGANALIGLSIGIGVAVVLVLCVILFPRIRPAVYLMGIIAKVSPAIAYAPLLLGLFGTGTKIKIVTAGLFCLYPMIVDSLRALDRASSRLNYVAFVYDLGPFARARVFAWAYVVEALARSLVTAAPLAVIGSIVADYVMAGTRPVGLGGLIMAAATGLDNTTLLLRCAAASTILGVMAFTTMHLLSLEVGRVLSIDKE